MHPLAHKYGLRTTTRRTQKPKHDNLIVERAAAEQEGEADQLQPLELLPPVRAEKKVKIVLK